MGMGRSRSVCVWGHTEKVAGVVRRSLCLCINPCPPLIRSSHRHHHHHITYTHKKVGLRSLVGVGEACYVVIATPMIADFFPSKARSVA